MQTPVNSFARWWLSGPKYDRSRAMYGESWNIPVEKALGYHGLTLTTCRDMHDVVRIFRGRWFWVSDGFYALDDNVKPPDHLLVAGDDCDGWAMIHTQALNFALGSKGWVWRIVSYEADPWWMSHHFSLGRSPIGEWWVCEPQPTKEQWQKYGESNQTIYGPYRSKHEAIAATAAMHGSVPLWHDIRDGLYQPATF